MNEFVQQGERLHSPERGRLYRSRQLGMRDDRIANFHIEINLRGFHRTY